MRQFISSLILLTLVSPIVHAESWKETAKAELASPWTTDARPWLIGGTALTGLLLLLDDETVDPLQDSWSKRKPLGDWALWGDYGGQAITNGVYILSMMGMYWASDDEEYKRHAGVMARASTYAISVNYLIKLIAHEERPNKANYMSFPSGHSASAFAFSSVVWAEHGWAWGLPATALSLLTGASRINDNEHYLHDIVGGATVGISYGLGVSYWNRRSNSSSSTVTWHFVPWISSKAQLAYLSVAF